MSTRVVAGPGIPAPEQRVTLYLTGGQAPAWTLTAADAAQVADTVRAFWDDPSQFAPRDRVMSFGPGSEVTTHLPLAHVIGMDVTPARAVRPKGATRGN